MSQITTIGAPAPSFTLQSGSGQLVSLSDYRGKRVVLYFYPKDDTPTCTKQACEFRDAHQEFEGLNAVIVGISTDPVQKHERFVSKYGLPFTLLSDEDHAVCEAYGVWQQKKLYGKTYMGIVRSTFLIDEEGRIAMEWRNIKLAGHIGKVLEVLRASTNEAG